MFEDGKYCDVTCILDEETIKCHSFILAARSEVFDRELNGGMNESISKVIIIEDCDATTFKGFLRFLYTDDLDCIKELSLQSMLAVSHKYQVARLQLYCEQQLCDGITTENICSVLRQAHLYQASQLEKVCLTFLRDHMNLVVVTPEFVSLSKEWPDLMLKLNTFLAGLPLSSVATALNVQHPQEWDSCDNCAVAQSAAEMPANEPTDQMASPDVVPVAREATLCRVAHAFDAAEYGGEYLNLSEGQYVLQLHADSDGWGYGTRVNAEDVSTVVGPEPTSGWYLVECVQPSA